MSSFLACFSFVKLNHLISLVSFCEPHTFLFFFFCSQKYNKKLWNWVLINLGPVSNCPFSACLSGFVHVCQFVCPCLRLWTCHAPSPCLYNKKLFFWLTAFILAFSVVLAFRIAQTAASWDFVFVWLLGQFKVKPSRAVCWSCFLFQVGGQFPGVFGELLCSRFLQRKGKRTKIIIAFFERKSCVKLSCAELVSASLVVASL